ncbi:hypothetical protein Tco_1275634 [Tanacetum coccineum]
MCILHLSETVVESEPNVVMSKVWTDAPIIEEVDSDNEYVVTPGKANEKPSHADNKSAKFINTPRDMGNKQDSRRHMGKQVDEGYAFPKKACFVCGSLSHLIKDCDFHEKRMAQEQAMAKQNEKTNGMGNFNRKWDKMTMSSCNQFSLRFGIEVCGGKEKDVGLGELGEGGKGVVSKIRDNGGDIGREFFGDRRGE